MSYDVQLFRVETKEKEQVSNDEAFFENEDNFVPFTSNQFQELKERLLSYGYNLLNEDNIRLHLSHPNEDFGLALLTDRALYFTAGWNENSIFEVGMTASEFIPIRH